MSHNISYLKWWFKHRKGVLWFNIKDAFRYPKYTLKNFFSFLLNDGVRYSDSWNVYSALSEKFLRMTRRLRQTIRGYPGIETDPNVDTFEHWQDTIKKIRLAHFWIWWDGVDPTWMIESAEDRKNAYVWLKRKYPFAAEFITPRFLKRWCSDVHLQWKLHMENVGVDEYSDETVGGPFYQLKFFYIHKSSQQVVEDTPDGYDHKELDVEMEKKYQEGMNLFTRYYRHLWD